MKDHIFYTAGTSQALQAAASILQKQGYIFSDVPNPTVTHLLFDIPSHEVCPIIPASVSSDVTVIGGKLNISNCKTIDLLQDPEYLAENAAITAHCAVKVAMQHIPFTLNECPILVIGWGRIGKCLAKLLTGMGARVTVAARKATDRAILSALGYEALDTAAIGYKLVRYKLVFNTVPDTIIDRCTAQYFREGCIKIDLASSIGIEAKDVIWARGLPGKEAPASSADLIARAVARLIPLERRPL